MWNGVTFTLLGLDHVYFLHNSSTNMIIEDSRRSTSNANGSTIFRSDCYRFGVIFDKVWVDIFELPPRLHNTCKCSFMGYVHPNIPIEILYPSFVKLENPSVQSHTVVVNVFVIELSPMVRTLSCTMAIQVCVSKSN